MLDEYIKNNYLELKKMSSTITKGKKPGCEDLFQQTMVYLYETDKVKIETLIKKKQLRYWIARIMMNQYNSSSSKFHYTWRKHQERVNDAKNHIEEWQTSEDEKQLKELDFLQLEESIKKLPFFDRFIISIYYKEEHSLNSLSEATGISRTTIYKAIRKARNEIKRTW